MNRATDVLALASCVLLAGCFSEHVTVPIDGPVSFAQDVERFLASSCGTNGCHGRVQANPPAKPMRLDAGQSYGAIVEVASAQLPSMPRITPAQPDQSYLIHKIQGTHQQAGGSGTSMPQGRAAVPQATIAMMRRWITEGAQRN